tara:strand:- start:4376 stop:4588 length:213 start_codon:yes stop_codon:yes gene_type:complete
MNNEQIQGMWHQLKGKAQKQWGKLTDDDLTKINGQFEELSGTLQRKYGYAKEKADEEVNKFFHSNVDNKH